MMTKIERKQRAKAVLEALLDGVCRLCGCEETADNPVEYDYIPGSLGKYAYICDACWYLARTKSGKTTRPKYSD